MYNVIIQGFKTEKQAKAFINWYEVIGEQSFGENLDIIGLPDGDGCYCDMTPKKESGRYFTKKDNNIIIDLKQF